MFEGVKSFLFGPVCKYCNQRSTTHIEHNQDVWNIEYVYNTDSGHYVEHQYRCSLSPGEVRYNHKMRWSAPE